MRQARPRQLQGARRCPHARSTPIQPPVAPQHTLEEWKTREPCEPMRGAAQSARHSPRGVAHGVPAQSSCRRAAPRAAMAALLARSGAARSMVAARAPLHRRRARLQRAGARAASAKTPKGFELFRRACAALLHAAPARPLTPPPRPPHRARKRGPPLRAAASAHHSPPQRADRVTYKRAHRCSRLLPACACCVLCVSVSVGAKKLALALFFALL